MARLFSAKRCARRDGRHSAHPQTHSCATLTGLASRPEGPAKCPSASR